MISHDEMLQLCVNLKITANQFNFCYLIYLKDWTSLRKYTETTYINATGEKKSLALRQSELDDLIARGYIINLFEERTNSSFMTTPKFTKLLFVEDQNAWEDFWEAYFDTFIINGMHQSAKTADKDALGEIYLRKIKRNKKKHLSVMQALNDYKSLVKQSKMQPMGIEKFVTGENWEVVKKIITNKSESWNDSV